MVMHEDHLVNYSGIDTALFLESFPSEQTSNFLISINLEFKIVFF